MRLRPGSPWPDLPGISGRGYRSLNDIAGGAWICAYQPVLERFQSDLADSYRDLIGLLSDQMPTTSRSRSNPGWDAKDSSLSESRIHLRMCCHSKQMIDRLGRVDQGTRI